LSNVWIAQCLCPKRHAILACGKEADGRSEAEDLITYLRTQVKRMIGSGTFNPWCGLCKAPIETWGYELSRTHFRSMQEAEPSLRQSERKQAEVRREFGDQ